MQLAECCKGNTAERVAYSYHRTSGRCTGINSLGRYFHWRGDRGPQDRWGMPSLLGPFRKVWVCTITNHWVPHCRPCSGEEIQTPSRKKAQRCLSTSGYSITLEDGVSWKRIIGTVRKTAHTGHQSFGQIWWCHADRRHRILPCPFWIDWPSATRWVSVTHLDWDMVSLPFASKLEEAILSVTGKPYKNPQ